jgi:phenylalanyl-tRNA synthetase beta chain
MRVSEIWLREMVNPALTREELTAQLTMAGLEVDAVESAAPAFTGVRIGEIREIHPHPNADRLRVCQVAFSATETLQIVTGAANVRVGMHVAVAVVGAELPGGVRIVPSELRGVPSAGMLCSEKELGLAEATEGVMDLPADAPLGADIRDWLRLDDAVFELNLTPNRADCLSMEGIAREVAALNGIGWKPVECGEVPPAITELWPVAIEAPEDCPRYLGRLIRGVNPAAQTPVWLKERLRRAGLRSLGPLVDITNYVLLELGQPLHAFDAGKLSGAVRVRRARAGERLLLLNDQEVTLDEEALVIADDTGPLALAGVMGGRASAVSDSTRDIFLECAFFSPAAMVGRARRFGLHTDSSHRFERGVDPHLQRRAIERATHLILSLSGGAAGPVSEWLSETHLPQRRPIALRLERVRKILGVPFAAPEVEAILTRLGMRIEPSTEGWRVTPPGFRFDLGLEADLVEELGRVHGYDNLPQRIPALGSTLRAPSETCIGLARIQDLLVDRGYREAITYSFADREILDQLTPEISAIPLRNPISAELGVMRTTLWAGLLRAAQFNLNRREARARLFESGLRFRRENGAILQEKCLAGLLTGLAVDEQWGASPRAADFYDLKADIEAVLDLSGRTDDIRFAAAIHPALHPGQSAAIFAGERLAGWLGMLHPRLEKELDFPAPVFLFEIEQSALENRPLPAFRPLSKFPPVRRDIAVVVREATQAGEVLQSIARLRHPLIRQAWIFDLYRGQGIESACKSLAIGLDLQDPEETLTDERIDAVVGEVLESLARDCQAQLRI